MTITKTFYEENTRMFYKSLKDAKAASRFSYVCRVWVDDFYTILAKEPLYCYGTSVCTISSADKNIQERLKETEE